MEFTIEFYESRSGRCPLREFLDKLKETNSDDFTVVMAGLAKLRNRQFHKPPLSKPVGENLFELRHVGKLNTRVLYFFCKRAEDYCCAWYSKQSKKNINEGF